MIQQKRDLQKEQAQRRLWSYDLDSHGSTKWADIAHLTARGYGPAGRHTLGYLPEKDARHGAARVSYGGDRHELIVAPTRGGKGVSGAIPRLLEHPGSAIVLDIKDGELALITARYRRDVLAPALFARRSIFPEHLLADIAPQRHAAPQHIELRPLCECQAQGERRRILGPLILS